MNAKDLSAALVIGDGRWQAVLPEPYAIGSHPCKLEVHTVYSYNFGKRKKVPPINPDEIELCLLILAKFDSIREQAVSRFVEYCLNADPEPAKHLCNPSIEVGRQSFEEEGVGRWSFVLQRDDWDGIFSIGFENDRALYINAGD